MRKTKKFKMMLAGMIASMTITTGVVCANEPLFPEKRAIPSYDPIVANINAVMGSDDGAELDLEIPENTGEVISVAICDEEDGEILYAWQLDTPAADLTLPFHLIADIIGGSYKLNVGGLMLDVESRDILAGITEYVAVFKPNGSFYRLFRCPIYIDGHFDNGVVEKYVSKMTADSDDSNDSYNGFTFKRFVWENDIPLKPYSDTFEEVEYSVNE